MGVHNCFIRHSKNILLLFTPPTQKQRLAELESQSSMERQNTATMMNQYERQLEKGRQSSIHLSRNSSFISRSNVGSKTTGTSSQNGSKFDTHSLLMAASRTSRDSMKIQSLKDKFRSRRKETTEVESQPTRNPQQIKERVHPEEQRHPQINGRILNRQRSSNSASQSSHSSHRERQYNAVNRPDQDIPEGAGLINTNSGSGNRVLSDRHHHVGEEMFQHLHFYERSLQAVGNE